MKENGMLKKITTSFTALIAISLFGILSLLVGVVWWQEKQKTETKVVFLDVGQGDAILIQQGTFQILIDGGKDGKRLLGELGRYVPFWDRSIEMIILTHPDADHIGGFAELAKSYSVRHVFFTGATSETDYYKNVVEKVGKRVAFDSWQILLAGSDIHLPQEGVLKILYPKNSKKEPQKDEDTNEGSIVARLEYGKTSFLFTGDLPYEETVLSGLTPVDILKAAHHGSKYSTSQTFLDLAKPKEAVISVGENTYGHPHKDVLERLEKNGVVIRRTDQEGSLTYGCQHQQCFYQERF